ncbi:16960_t:CDS:2 [Funneliformis caledonium]|uniref:16960_t:CDS:1 n=1 Tax=Funneliformis caledonium TaxID=1117310 RepID=A0A9N8ZJA6_9GLOM|nr:16960_t:CDS:2 [Funneliformis caledonium]
MEEASKQRKERLEALRKRKLGNEPENNKEEVKEEGKNEKLPLKFRNYTPINEDIKAISKINISTPKDITETLEKTDLFNLAPKKPNWDLKRDVEKKLAKLDKITQASIAELIRIRLQGESNENSTVDLVDAINAQQKADTDGEVSD